MTPLLDTAALRAAGRTPSLPARLRLDDGREIEVLRALRVLPEKRVVAEARLGDEAVLAKLFIANGAERHLAREREGLAALAAAAIPTPECLLESGFEGGGQALLTRFLPHATSLAAVWNAAPRPPGDPQAMSLLRPVLTTLAHMHAAGLTQTDLHLGNFLLEGDTLHVIDGDAVERHSAPLDAAAATANLALLFAQFPPPWDEHVPTLLDAYVAAGGISPRLDLLHSAIAPERTRRLDDLLAKTVRDCSLFAVTRSATRFTAVVRDEATSLTALLADPDTALQGGCLLKDGNTATVARVEVNGRACVIKRYNLKSFGHALSRAWRPSRAWHAWRAAHRLRFFSIATPRPLALIEERLGPVRRRAWLVTEHCPGDNLLTLLDPHHIPPEPIGAALVATFRALHAVRIHHGDLKATNLLWHDGHIMLIDLDATTAHTSDTAFARAWARDRDRLLRNWPDGSVLRRWLDAALPSAHP